MKLDTLGQLPNGTIFRPVDCTALLLVRVGGQDHRSVVVSVDPILHAVNGSGFYMSNKREVQIISLGKGGKSAVTNSRQIIAQAEGYYFSDDPRKVRDAAEKTSKIRSKQSERQFREWAGRAAQAMRDAHAAEQAAIEATWFKPSPLPAYCLVAVAKARPSRVNAAELRVMEIIENEPIPVAVAAKRAQVTVEFIKQMIADKKIKSCYIGPTLCI